MDPVADPWLEAVATMGPGRDMRAYARGTQLRLVAGGVFLALIVGSLLICWIYGADAGRSAFICTLLALLPIALIWGLLAVVGWIARRADGD